MHRSAACALGMLALAGCYDAQLAGPRPSAAARPTLSANPTAPGARTITVMTRNLYIGADVDQVIGALASPDPNDDVPALLAAIAVLQRTDFPTRAGALADEIARARPHVVGLQEVDQLHIDLSGLGLESGDAAGLAALRVAQATELVGSIGTTSPAILLGDFNDMPGSSMYGVVTSGGFTDSWAALRPGARGFTCCEVADLSNHVAVLNQRIDYVFARGIGGPNGSLLGVVPIVGVQPGGRGPGPSYPILPSDHPGVVATFRALPDVALN